MAGVIFERGLRPIYASIMLSLLTRTKSFRDPWVGHPILNRQFQLHRRRVELAETLCTWRRWLKPGRCADLERDGFVVIQNFLPPSQFAALRDEVESRVSDVALQHPMPVNNRVGFQPKQPFTGGFDRFDGGTLNRFLHVDPLVLPQAAAVCLDPRLSSCSRQVIGLPMDHHKVDVYLTVHGEESETPDLQKDLHRDTFFRALKFWLFLRPVESDDGPFEYVPGSHRLDPVRLRWEQSTADAALLHRRQPDVSGSFRIQDEALASLGLPKPVAVTCPANTLVLADVFGFHRRGAAVPGRQRLALYGWNRPYPFLPITW